MAAPALSHIAGSKPGHGRLTGPDGFDKVRKEIWFNARNVEADITGHMANHQHSPSFVDTNARLPVPIGTAAAAAGLMAALVFSLAAAPTITWLDSAELAASAFGLGIAHPPGHPLPSMLGHLVATLIPLGNYAFRCVLASSLAMGVAVSALVWLGAWFIQKTATAWAGQTLRQPSGISLLALAAMPAALFFSTTAVWSQAVRVEVYATQAATMLTALTLLAAWLQTSRTSHLAASALATGLSLSNHHMQALALALPAGLAVVLAAKRRPKQILVWLGFVAAGLLVWLYLPVRASRQPLVNWGHPDSLRNLWWLLSTKLYYKTATKAVTQGIALRLAFIGAYLATQITIPATLLALLGAYLGLRKKGSAWLTALVLTLILTSGLSAALSGFDSTNPDSWAYTLLALTALCLLATLPIALLSSLPSLQGRRGAVTAILAAATVGIFISLVANNEALTRYRNDWSASDTAFVLADSLLPDTVLLTGYHETTFLFWYAQTAEAQRPDVCAVFRHGLSLPGRFEQMKQVCPLLADIWKNHRLQTDGLVGLHRPVAVELDDHRADPFPASLLRSLRPQGPVAWLEPTLSEKLPPPSPNRLQAEWEAFSDRIPHQHPTEGRKRFDLWHSYQECVLWVKLGRCDLAYPAWSRAWRLAPSDPLLSDLARRCRFVPPNANSHR